MPGAADHFAAFLDRLADDLDGVPERGEARAAAAGLSRWHFDKVIAAVGGETPDRLRNRLLLERAAWYLAASDVPVLDVALAAGYSSQAAFTRAFARAYGAPPGRWRHQPRSLHLPAANGVHFHPPGGLRLPARSRMGSVDVLMQMVGHHVSIVEGLVDRADRLTAEQLDAPLTTRLAAVDGDSLRRVLSRLVGQLAMWNAAVAGTAYDFGVEENESVLSMRRRLGEAAPRFVTSLQEIADADRFDETFVEAFSPRPVVMTYAAMVSHVLTFAAHRRLVALERLAECGITDLGLGDPKVWFNPAPPS